MPTARVSPTAHYTAWVWARNDLAHPALTAAVNPWLFRVGELVIRPLALVSRSPTVEAALLQRHHGIDTLLERAITNHGVRQVVEVPGGLASRGRRFVQRHPDLIYVEGDLADMAATKQVALAGEPHPRHHVVALDLVAQSGPSSLEEAVGPLLDPTVPTAFITEGLLYYLPPAIVDQALRRTSAFLSGFPSGHYFADVALKGHRSALMTGFLGLVSMVARGRVRTHFDGPSGAVAELRKAGFTDARVMPAVADPDAGPAPGEIFRVHLLAAQLRPSKPAVDPPR